MKQNKSGKKRRGGKDVSSREWGKLSLELGRGLERVRRLQDEMSAVRRLAGEGVVAIEMLRLQSGGVGGHDTYTQLRRKALGDIVLGENRVEKLGLRVDGRAEVADKYPIAASTAPCAELRDICHGVCCKERFPLTPQDIVEGVVEFDLEEPYLIKMSPSGYCVHLDTDSMRCRIWEQRPARCRLYTCRWDRGVWKDYVKGVPSEKIAELFGQKDLTSAKDPATVTVKGKPGIMLDPSTFHVFQCDGDRLLYDVATGQIMHVNPVAFDILSENGSADRATAGVERSLLASPKRVSCLLRRSGMGILPMLNVPQAFPPASFGPKALTATAPPARPAVCRDCSE